MCFPCGGTYIIGHGDTVYVFPGLRVSLVGKHISLVIFGDRKYKY